MQSSQPKFTPSRLSMVNSLNDAPYFKGKAGNTLKVAMWLSTVATSLADQRPLDMHLTLIATMLFGYVDIIVCCQGAEQILSDAEVARLGVARECALHSHRALSTNMMALGVRRYPPKPKMHVTDHVVRLAMANKVNPLWSWTFADEDFIGRIKKIACKVHVNRMSERVIQRYLCKFFSDGRGASVV